MSLLPEEFLRSIEGVKGFDKNSFIEVHQKGEKVTSVRINPAKSILQTEGSPSHDDVFSVEQEHPIKWKIEGAVPWCENGFYLALRPSFTFDPYFHAGCYYVQEASSMFLEVALKQLTDLSTPIKILDLSAAPGGKSTHIQSIISSDSLLVSNDVIRTRALTLRDNIIKWGCSNVIVTNNDPLAFQKVPNFFDVIVVDAPCSGSGLFRKDVDAITEWSLNNVQLCSQRQKRILADVLPALKEDGFLIYSTCSYSEEEDEQIMDWLVQEMEVENVSLQLKEEWNILSTQSKETSSTGYRFFPDKVKGEGFFLACFKKKSATSKTKRKETKAVAATSNELQIIEKFIDIKEYKILKREMYFQALLVNHVADYYELKQVLNIQYAGIELGEIMKGRLVPHHALAVNCNMSHTVADTSLSYIDAIKYLQKQDLAIEPLDLGWQTVSYGKYKLGWINALKNRINNYYPKEMRILKHYNDATFEK